MRSPFFSPRTLVCLFFAAFLALGLCTAADYGRPWDESDEMDILRANLWEYARALHLDETPFEAWVIQENKTISSLAPISQSIERDHGVAAFYPLAGVVLNRALTEQTRATLWHMWCWVLFTLGAYALYACCRALGLPRWCGVLAALFLLLSPRFFAQGHYNNKDIALMSLALCVLWQALWLMRKPTFARAVLFGLAGALAANVKIVGLALWALCALCVLVRQIAGKRLTGRVAAVGAAALVSLALCYALLTPALWAQPVDFAVYLLRNSFAFGRWQNYVRFRGATFWLAEQRLPWYYLPYMALVTTPLWVLGLIATGLVFCAAALLRGRRSLWKDDRLMGLLLAALLGWLPLALAMLTRTSVYNGWRHFYFLYGFWLLLAAYGLNGLWERLGRKGAARRAACALLALLMAGTGAGLVRQHPYQYAYYQPLARLLTEEDDLELDYWNVSVANALQTLAGQTEGEIVLAAADLWAREGLERTLPALNPLLRARITLAKEADEAEYVLVNPTYALFSGFTPTPGMAKAVELTAYGRAIMRVYRQVHESMEEIR